MDLDWIFIEVDAELVGSNMVSGRNGIGQTKRGDHLNTTSSHIPSIQLLVWLFLTFVNLEKCSIRRPVYLISMLLFILSC